MISLQLRLSVTLTVVVGVGYLMLNVRHAIRESLVLSVELTSNLIDLLLRHLPPESVETLAGQLDAQLAGVEDMRHSQIIFRQLLISPKLRDRKIFLSGRPFSSKHTLRVTRRIRATRIIKAWSKELSMRSRVFELQQFWFEPSRGWQRSTRSPPT